jgi:hypothetical protein
MLNESDKIQLQQMMDKHPVEDQTAKIRDLKYSQPLREAIELLVEMKDTHSTLLKEDKASFEDMYLKRNPFLFYHFFELYNMLLKETLDMTILNKILNVLSDIEDGKYTQQEGSYAVGMLLKEIYIDTKLKETRETVHSYVEPKPIRWNEYKNLK